MMYRVPILETINWEIYKSSLAEMLRDNAVTGHFQVMEAEWEDAGGDFYSDFRLDIRIEDGHFAVYLVDETDGRCPHGEDPAQCERCKAIAEEWGYEPFWMRQRKSDKGGDIFDTKLLFVKIGTNGVDIKSIAVEDLRWENQGRAGFVRNILATVCRGEVYDDSDPDAHLNGGPFYYYLPGDKAKVNGIPASTLVRLLEVLESPAHRQLVSRLLELGRDADTASPARLREIDEERAEIEAELADTVARCLSEVSGEE